MTTESTETVKETTDTATGVEQIWDDFDSAFGIEPTPDPVVTPTVETPAVTPATEGSVPPADDEVKTEDTPAPVEDFDPSLLDLELKRFDEKKTLRQFLKERPEDVKIALQQKWDYEARKEEWRTQRAAEQAEIEKSKQEIDAVILRNLALEVGLEPKTLEDFENDLRYEDSEEAFSKYQEQLKEKVQPFLSSKKRAEAQNTEMIEDFSRTYKDVKIEELFKDMRPYLNSSVAMGYVPFPEDALEVFYRGKNFDSLVKAEVEKARIDERKKAYDEIKKGTNTTLNKTPGVQGTEPLKVDANLPPEVQDFENAWKL